MFSFLSQNTVLGQESQKPNILFIAVDDLKPNLGCFGNSVAITPNIDEIAKKGMVFTKAYCQQAVCAPSRASLLTGRYPDQTQVWDLNTLIRDKNPDILTLPQYFKENGYNSYGVGKIFDYRSVESNDAVSWNRYGNPYQNSLYNQSTGKPSYFYAAPSAKDTIALLENEAIRLGVDKKTYVEERYWPSIENANVPYDAYVDGAISKEGINLLNQLYATGNPFFLAVGFMRPHLPFNAPKEFWDLYRREDFKLADFPTRAINSPSIAYHNSEELRSYTDIPKQGQFNVEKQLELIHGYYASVSYIDFLVGKLIQRLEDLDLAKNTIIVLWGDHGWHFGDHNLWCKHSNFEEATRSPLILSYPGQPNAGQVYSYPTEFTDIATTLAELAGLKVPLDFEGESLIQAVENPEIPIREGALSQYPRNQYMGYTLRTNRYRYTKWVGKDDGAHFAAELYDYETDPLETTNMLGHEEYADIQKYLDSLVKARIKLPSTQEKTAWKIRGVSGKKDTVDVAHAELFFDGQKIKTDAEGNLTLTHVPGEYDFSVNAKGYQSANSKIVVKNDTLIRVFLQQELYDVNIKVMGDWNKKEIENAKVTLGNHTKNTNASGDVVFNDHVFDLYDIRIELVNGFSQDFTGVEIFSDTTLVLYVSEPVFNVTITASNKYTSDGIYETMVTLGDISGTSNSDGTTVLLIPEGKHRIELQHPKYALLADSIEIFGDTLFNYPLTPAFSTLKIKLSQGTTPVNNASVTIEGIQQISNALGNVFFKDYPAFQQYNYLVEKDRYNAVSGSLFLINDTTLFVQMEPVTGAKERTYFKELKIWPNPVIDYIHFTLPPEIENGLVKILDLEGRIIEIYDIKYSGNHSISLGHLSSGNYFFQINAGNRKIRFLLAKS
jgi:arylsulfatase A-like enzyme